MSGEIIPLKLVVNTIDEASIGFVYQKSDSEDKKQWIYKIFLENIYTMEKVTREGAEQRILEDHQILQKGGNLLKEKLGEAINEIIKKRNKIRNKEKSKKKVESDSLADMEGVAAKIPSTKSK
ncbi:unnamed protein product [Paramecium sonneborni]|uniref:Uncharacterized protein n=1 Tax=Paramecium sonneborni TaxID=65129 RepID=A0A8S1PDB9_9CILI|nr:unnamed protein product [Paramecium sonneborni]